MVRGGRHVRTLARSGGAAVVAGTLVVLAAVATGGGPVAEAVGTPPPLPAAAGRLTTLPDPPGTQGDQFGWSVAVSRRTAVVGSPQTTPGSGAVYVYQRGTSGWSATPVATLHDPVGAQQDQFGWSVAVSGPTIVVGALDIPSRGHGIGAAYVYERGASGWPTVPTAVLHDPAPQPPPPYYDYFGWSVAVSGATVAVGAYGTDDAAGAAYLYREGRSGWPTAPTATLLDPPGRPGDSFGWSVAVSGDTALVGALDTDHGAGAVYFYQRAGGGWPSAPAVAVPDPVATGVHEFGHTVRLSATTAVVGADGPNSQADGAAYVFDRGPSGWPAAPTVTLPDPAGATQFDQFGWSVGLSKDLIAVSAPDSGTGTVYLYPRTSRGWPTTPTSIVVNPGSAGEFFGFSLDQSGRSVVIGAPVTGNGEGSASVFRANGPRNR